MGSKCETTGVVEFVGKTVYYRGKTWKVAGVYDYVTVALKPTNAGAGTSATPARIENLVLAA